MPPEYIKYTICKEFGWTPNEYDEQDLRTLYIWQRFMNIEAEEYKKKTDRNKKQPTKSNFR